MEGVLPVLVLGEWDIPYSGPEEGGYPVLGEGYLDPGSEKGYTCSTTDWGLPSVRGPPPPATHTHTDKEPETRDQGHPSGKDLGPETGEYPLPPGEQTENITFSSYYVRGR